MYKRKSLLAHLVGEEKKRNRILHARYKKILAGLPRGKPYVRKIGRKGKSERAYVYLNRRIPGQRFPESKYIGVAGSEEVKRLYEQLEDRAKLEAQIASLELEKRMIEKALDEYKRTR